MIPAINTFIGARQRAQRMITFTLHTEGPWNSMGWMDSILYVYDKDQKDVPTMALPFPITMLY